MHPASIFQDWFSYSKRVTHLRIFGCLYASWPCMFCAKTPLCSKRDRRIYFQIKIRFGTHGGVLEILGVWPNKHPPWQNKSFINHIPITVSSHIQLQANYSLPSLQTVARGTEISSWHFNLILTILWTVGGEQKPSDQPLCFWLNKIVTMPHWAMQTFLRPTVPGE